MTYENDFDNIMASLEKLNRKEVIKLVFDSSKLKGLIRERGLTQEDVAEEINVACSTFNLKLNGNAFFTQEEIYKISNLFKIPKESFYEYFFTEKV